MGPRHSEVFAEDADPAFGSLNVIRPQYLMVEMVPSPFLSNILKILLSSSWSAIFIRSYKEIIRKHEFINNVVC